MINATFSEALETFNECLNELGLEPFNETEARDLGIVGGETNAQLSELAHDIYSDEQTEKSAARDAWRYEV